MQTQIQVWKVIKAYEDALKYGFSGACGALPSVTSNTTSHVYTKFAGNLKLLDLYLPASSFLKLQSRFKVTHFFLVILIL